MKATALAFPFTAAVDDRRRVRIFGEEIVPGLEHNRMHEHDLAGNVAGLLEVGGSAVAHIDHRHMLHAASAGAHAMETQRTRNSTLGICASLGSSAVPVALTRHLGRALRPGIRNGETFGVNAVGAGGFERLHAPLDGALHGGRAGHASADFVRQMAQVALESEKVAGRPE